jgi:hypothetical protein
MDQILGSRPLVQQLDEQLVLDFLTTLIAPHELTARVVVNATGLARMVEHLQRNLTAYEERFGPAFQSASSAGRSCTDLFEGNELYDTPTDAFGGEMSPSNARQFDIARLYKGLTLPDERLVGLFADSLTVRFTSSEFCLDFIANFYPRSVVARRIMVAAPRIPPLLATLVDALDKRHG